MDRKARIAELRAKRKNIGSNQTDVSNATNSKQSLVVPSLADIAHQIEQAEEEPSPMTVGQRYTQDIKPLLDRLDRGTTQKLVEYAQEKYQRE